MRIHPFLREVGSGFWAEGGGPALLLAASTSFGAILGTVAPLLLAAGIDDVARDGGGLSLFLGYALLLGLIAIADRAKIFLETRMTEALDYAIAIEVFRKISRKSPGFFVSYNAAEITAVLARATEALRFLVAHLVMAIWPDALRLVLSLILLGAVLSPDVALIVALYGGALMLATVAINRRARLHLRRAIKAGQVRAAFVGGAVAAMPAVQQYRSTNWLISENRSYAARALAEWRQFTGWHLRMAWLFGAFLATQIGATFWLILPRVEAGVLSIGDLVLFNVLSLQLASPFQVLGRLVEHLLWARECTEPLADLWDRENAEDGGDRGIRISEGRVRFSAVTHLFGKGRGVRGIDFEARRGAITFITGPSGAGKSTTLNLALKVLAPQSGEITIDGQSLARIRRDDWFARIAVVPQDPVLLNLSIAENVRLGRPYNALRLERALRHAALLPLIQRLPQGVETPVGEFGSNLSGGERQRIAIARALYGDPAILFLDEASASLDETTEREILGELRRLSHRTTIIAITHRIGTIRPDDVEYALPPGSPAVLVRSV